MAHADIPTLEAIARLVAEHLGSYAGVKDVDDGIAAGQPQWSLTLTAEGANVGLTVEAIGEQLRSAFYGAEALRQQRGRNEIKVMVRLPQRERQSLDSVSSYLLPTPGGGEISLLQAAKVQLGHAYRAINRTDGRRGRAEDFQGFRDDLVLGVTVALIAIPLGSYLQPLLVVMAAIPFGFVGALLAHFLLGMPLSMFSLMGMLALGGVVVNDSIVYVTIVYVTAANENRRAGQDALTAALDAACRRFRPILLTTLTTFFGLSPIILETSPEAQMMIPRAVTLAFGILVATAFVLILVPCLYVLVENLRQGRSGVASYLAN